MKKSVIIPGLALMTLFTMGAVQGTPEGEDETRAPEAWNVDKPHTEVNFSVKHFFTPVTGTFKDYDIELLFDEENPANSSVTVTVQVASIDTKNERRDNPLRSPDFFDAERYPTMTFRSTSIREDGPNRLIATGDLTIKETTEEVELAIDILGIRELPPEMQEMLGGVTRVAGFDASTQVDRRAFEVGVANWAQTIIVGGEVDISIHVEANQR